ncbi:MAG: hypothetical protein ACI4WT_06985 [Oligosphaeraceae bacterium]
MLRLTALATTLALGLAVAQEAPKPPAEGHRPQNKAAKARRPMMNPKRFADAKAEILKRYDADGDGILAAAEQEKLDADLKAANELTRLHRQYQIFVKLDANGDGTITPEEQQRLREVMQEMQAQDRERAPRPGMNRPGMNRRGGDNPPPPPPANQD